MRRLHEALPPSMNFSIGRSDFQHTYCDEDGTRDPANTRHCDPEWTVVVQGPDGAAGADRYLHASLGTDLAAVVGAALEHFARWAAGRPPSTGDAGKPPKLSAPGSANRTDSQRRRKDVS